MLHPILKASALRNLGFLKLGSSLDLPVPLAHPHAPRSPNVCPQASPAPWFRVTLVEPGIELYALFSLLRLNLIGLPRASQ